MTTKTISSSGRSAEDPRFLAALEFIGRTGASSVDIRFQDDEQPIVWMVIAQYDGDNPAKTVGAEVDAAFNPLRAALRLCERLCDGGQCRHCGRPTGLEPDSIDTMPVNNLICWYQYDPGAKKFIRGCT